jgi:hypothetical protein
MDVSLLVYILVKIVLPKVLYVKAYHNKFHFHGQRIRLFFYEFSAVSIAEFKGRVLGYRL